MSSQSSEVVESVPAVASGTKMSWPLDPVDMSTGPVVPWMFRSKCGPLGAPFPVTEVLADAELPTSSRLNRSGEARTAPTLRIVFTALLHARTEVAMKIESMLDPRSVVTPGPRRVMDQRTYSTVENPLG